MSRRRRDSKRDRNPGASGGARVRSILSGYKRLLRWLEIVCWCVAALGIGAYSLVYLDRAVYQAYEQWSFQQTLEHKRANVPGFLFHMLHTQGEYRDSSEPAGAYGHLRGGAEAAAKPIPRLAPGAGEPIGRIQIPRIGLQAMIVESTTTDALRRAVGHIEGTALPGDNGNVALAGHRDTFFRGLRDVRKDDIIRVDTLDGSWAYKVESTEVVEPDDLEVLAASAGPTLTLVTCYPFNYVGAAPHRFVVRAREIEPALKGKPSETQAILATPKPSPGF